MQLKWTNLAAADLDHIEAHITQENSPLVAVEVVLQIINTTEMVLSAHPGAGRLGRVKETRELVVDGIPFIVIYRKANPLNQLHVLRVLHDSQQGPPE